MISPGDGELMTETCGGTGCVVWSEDCVAV
jgi:hypothetical protein